MPDLKSELSKVITSWNNDMPTTDTTPTITHSHTNTGRPIKNNATRITFNYVRDNPGVTSTQATIALGALGVNKSSSTSLISVMVTRGNLRKTADGSLFALQQEYVPIRTPASKRRKPKVEPKIVVGVPVKPVEPAPQINAAWDAETLLNNLSIKQARALYDELRKIFGG